MMYYLQEALNGLKWCSGYLQVKMHLHDETLLYEDITRVVCMMYRHCMVMWDPICEVLSEALDC